MFAGTMLSNSSMDPFYAFAPGGRGGRELYLFQGTYPERFTMFPATFLSRQMTLSEGGLVSPVNDSLGYSTRLISLSLTSNLPWKAARIPIKPFINILFNDHGKGSGKNSPLFIESGLKAGIWKVFEIYFPFYVSENIGSITGSVKERIRFVLSLDSFLNVRSNKSILN
jgi:hypothetical protein